MRADNMEPPIMRASSRPTKNRPLAPSELAQLRLGMPVLIHAADRATILDHSTRLRYFLRNAVSTRPLRPSNRAAVLLGAADFMRKGSSLD